MYIVGSSMALHYQRQLDSPPPLKVSPIYTIISIATSQLPYAARKSSATFPKTTFERSRVIIDLPKDYKKVDSKQISNCSQSYATL